MALIYLYSDELYESMRYFDKLALIRRRNICIDERVWAAQHKYLLLMELIRARYMLGSYDIIQLIDEGDHIDGNTTHRAAYFNRGGNWVSLFRRRFRDDREWMNECVFSIILDMILMAQ